MSPSRPTTNYRSQTNRAVGPLIVLISRRPGAPVEMTGRTSPTSGQLMCATCPRNWFTCARELSCDQTRRARVRSGAQPRPWARDRTPTLLPRLDAPSSRVRSLSISIQRGKNVTWRVRWRVTRRAQRLVRFAQLLCATSVMTGPRNSSPHVSNPSSAQSPRGPSHAQHYALLTGRRARVWSLPGQSPVPAKLLLFFSNFFTLTPKC
jgi:hypothetical protein